MRFDPNKPPRHVLLIATRRIGDVLLTTPLLRSLRKVWPLAVIDVLVFESTAGILAANPDVNRVIGVPERPGFWRTLKLAFRLFRRYDLALSTLAGDKPTLYAWLAGRHRVGMLDPVPKQQWKRRLLSQAVAFDNLDTHTVRMNLRLAEALGIAPCHEISAAWAEQDSEHLRRILPFDFQATPYAVLHPYPKFAYKTWSIEGWSALGKWLAERKLRVVLSGGPAADELDYVRRIESALPIDTVNLAGRLRWSECACLLRHAQAYVGPDTAMTHLAAAAGVPTVALYGPSNPVKWGPWPRGFSEPRNPYRLRGSQAVANVALLQGVGDCVPCMEEGCDRHVDSLSACLQNLPAEEVIAALRRFLG